MSFRGQLKSWIRTLFKINFRSWEHVPLRIKKRQHLVNFQAQQRFPFNSSQKANQDVYIFALSCLRKGPPLPLWTDLFRIQRSLYSDFKLLKTNEKREAMPNLQVLSDGKYFMLSHFLQMPRKPRKPGLTADLDRMSLPRTLPPPHLPTSTPSLFEWEVGENWFLIK